jgi:UDPglucose 6-dehydrogenase
MNVGIIGQGFVGSAIREGLNKHHDTLTYDLDPDKCNSTHEEVCNNSEIVFICVPTPMRVDGSCDTRILENAINEVHLACKPKAIFPIIVIKSTVPPGTTKRINEKYNDMAVLFSPEFLTEANSFKDFENQSRIIIGSHEDTKEEALKIKKMFKNVFLPLFTEIVIVDSKEAEMCKYFINCFLATKVTFANQMFQVCLDNDIDFKKVVNMSLLDKRIGNSHLSVPGPDGDLGFGGHCFPKDLAAMIYFGSKCSGDTSFLESVQQFNNKCRRFRDWEQMKGRAVSED